MLVAGRFLLPLLFAQAARTKSPELFLSISLLTVILASLATSAVGLSPILGALIAGILIAETDYSAEVEAITTPLAGLALGIFLITVGMRIDLPALLLHWPAILAAAVALLLVKAIVTAALLRFSGIRSGVAIETGIVMASPSETSLIVIGAAAAAGIVSRDNASFWSTVTAIGLTVTPVLAAVGRRMGRRVERVTAPEEVPSGKDRTIIFGFGRVGQMVADMPGAVARTSAFALNNATLPFALKIANLGAEEAMRQDPHLAEGLNVSGGKIRHQAVAEALDLPYEPVAA